MWQYLLREGLPCPMVSGKGDRNSRAAPWEGVEEMEEPWCPSVGLWCWSRAEPRGTGGGEAACAMDDLG